MSTGANGGDSMGPAGMLGNGSHPMPYGTMGQTPIDEKRQDGSTIGGDTGAIGEQNVTGGSKAAAAAAAEKKRPVRRGKPPPDRPVRALFCLPLTNPIRKMCIAIVEWKYPF